MILFSFYDIEYQTQNRFMKGKIEGNRDFVINETQSTPYHCLLSVAYVNKARLEILFYGTIGDKAYAYIFVLTFDNPSFSMLERTIFGVFWKVWHRYFPFLVVNRDSFYPS